MQLTRGFGCGMDGIPLLAEGHCQNRQPRRIRYGF